MVYNNYADYYRVSSFEQEDIQIIMQYLMNNSC